MDNFGAGFLFGNVDKEGRLESDDVFDDDEKKHLAGLSSITMGGVIDEYNRESKKLISDEDRDFIPPSPKAVDYSNISDDDLDFDEKPSEGKSKTEDSVMDIILPTISKEDIILPSMTDSETASEQKSSEAASSGQDYIIRIFTVKVCLILKKSVFVNMF